MSERQAWEQRKREARRRLVEIEDEEQAAVAVVDVEDEGRVA